MKRFWIERNGDNHWKVMYTVPRAWPPYSEDYILATVYASKEIAAFIKNSVEKEWDNFSRGIG